MNQLLDNRFAPITFSCGLLQCRFDRVAAAFRDWGRRNAESDATFTDGRGSLDHGLQHLLPLTTPQTRRLWIETSSKWVAYFDNSRSGSDPHSVVSDLTGVLACNGLTVSNMPDTLGVPILGREAGVSFRLEAGEAPGSVHLVRVIGVHNDGRRWKFNQYGEPLPFENVARYENPQVQDRFTAETLVEYCRVLGIRLTDSDYYQWSRFLMSSKPLHPQGFTDSLSDMRKRFGIE